MSRSSQDGSSSPSKPATSASTAAVSVDPPPLPPPPSPPVTAFQMTSAVLQFTVASVTMMIGNKAAMTSLPLPCTVIIIQALGTLLLLIPFREQMQSFRLDVARQWLPIAVLFTLMIFTSMKSFVYAGVKTVIIFRNIGAIITTIVEYYVRGTVVNQKIVAAELLILFGAVIYGSSALDFSWLGLFWIMVNIGGQVAYGVLVKWSMDTHPHFKEMCKYTMSLYNNALAIPMLLVVLVVQQEHDGIAPKLQNVSVGGWGTIALTCFFGWLISTSGFGLQKLVSATTFLVINNLTKFLNIMLGMLFLQDKIVNGAEAMGVLVALVAGFWYSYESMKFAEEQAAAAKERAAQQGA